MGKEEASTDANRSDSRRSAPETLASDMSIYADRLDQASWRIGIAFDLKRPREKILASLRTPFAQAFSHPCVLIHVSGAVPHLP